MATPAIGDLNGDGHEELVVGVSWFFDREYYEDPVGTLLHLYACSPCSPRKSMCSTCVAAESMISTSTCVCTCRPAGQLRCMVTALM